MTIDTGAIIHKCLPCKIKEIVAQLRLCRYECEGGPLENNLSFCELAEIADSHPDYWPDLEGSAVIVESDCVHRPIVTSFSFEVPSGDETGCAAEAWAQAEAYIVRLRAGAFAPVAVG